MGYTGLGSTDSIMGDKNPFLSNFIYLAFVTERFLCNLWKKMSVEKNSNKFYKLFQPDVDYSYWVL
jgi:hypothetical protein